MDNIQKVTHSKTPYGLTFLGKENSSKMISITDFMPKRPNKYIPSIEPKSKY